MNPFEPTWRDFRFSDVSDAFWEGWNRLHSITLQSTPMLDRRFLEPLIKFYGNRDLRVLALVDGRSSLAQARALLLVERRALHVASAFAPGQIQMPVVAFEPEIELNATQALLRLNGYALRLDLPMLDPRFVQKGRLQAPAVEHSDSFLTMSVDARRSFDEYWKERPQSLRKNIRRYFNRLKKEGVRYSVSLHSAPSEMPDAVHRYGIIETSGWKGEEGSAVAPHSEQGRFYTEVLENFARSGNALVAELLFDGAPVASRLCVQNHNELVILKTTYDESFRKMAPGRLLLYLLLEHLLDRSELESIEFYTNASQDQLQWSDESRHQYSISVYRNQIAQQLWSRARQVVGRFKGDAIEIETTRAGSARTEASFEVGVVRSLSELPKEVAAGWRSRGSPFFLSFEFFQAYLQEVEQGQVEPWLLFAKSNEDPSVGGVIPLQEQVAARGLRRQARALGNYYCPVFDIITWGDRETETRVALLRAVAEESRQLDTIDFLPVPTKSRLEEELLETFDTPEFGVKPYFFSANWRERVTSYEEYLNARPTQLKNTLRRKRRKLEQSSGYEFSVNVARPSSAQLEAYHEVYEASWKKAEPFPRFLEEMMTAAANRDCLRLGFLSVGKTVAAVQIWIVDDGVAYIYKLAHRPEYGKYSVGTLLTDEMSRYVIERDNIHTLDFLTGDDDYKSIWMDTRVELRGLRISNRTRIGGLLYDCLERGARSLSGAIERP